MGHIFQAGDTLPCFQSIIENLKEDAYSDTASFSLCYLQYLEKSGITDLNIVQNHFHKITLMAQFNKIGRTKPLDLLKIKDVAHSLETADTLLSYQNYLLKLCKNPKSFSSLYKSVDKNNSLCCFCPMSSMYTQEYEKEELLLLKYAIESYENLFTIVKDISSIDKVFIARMQLSSVFSEITQDKTFPYISILLRAVAENSTPFFMSFIQEKNYAEIDFSFKKLLKTYHIGTSKTTLVNSYAEKIYYHILSVIEPLPLISSKEEAQKLFTRISSRTAYVPLFDPDALPSLDVKVATDSGKKKQGSSSSKKKSSKKERKLTDDYIKNINLGTSMDFEMNLMDTPLKEYSSSGELNHDPVADYPIPSEKEFESLKSEHPEPGNVDIMDSDGIIIFNSDEYDDFIDEKSFNELNDNEEELPGWVSDTDVLGTVFNDSTYDDGIMSNSISNSSGSNDSLSESNIDGVTTVQLQDDSVAVLSTEDNVEKKELDYSSISELQNDENADSSSSFTTQGLTDIDNVYQELLYPMRITLPEFDSIKEVMSQSDTDRIRNLSQNQGYCIMEPVVYQNDTSYILIYVKNMIYKMTLEETLYFSEIVKRHNFKIGSLRLVLLYAMLLKYNHSVKCMEQFIPLERYFDKSGLISILSSSYIEQGKFLNCTMQTNFFKTGSYLEKERKSKYYSEYTMYGASLFRERMMNTDNCTGCYYTSDGNIMCTELNIDAKNLSSLFHNPGRVFIYTYGLTDDNMKKSEVEVCENKYFKLTKNVLRFICNKLCFLKFNMVLLEYDQNHITFYVDDYCASYINTITVMHLTKESTNMGIYPLQVTVKDIRVGENRDTDL